MTDQSPRTHARVPETIDPAYYEALGRAIKVARADLVGDCKWTDYLDYCDRFFWAVPPDLAAICEGERFLPGEAGLIVADRYDAALVRDAELLRFARRAARRLSVQIDPTLGEGR